MDLREVKSGWLVGELASTESDLGLNFVDEYLNYEMATTAILGESDRKEDDPDDNDLGF